MGLEFCVLASGSRGNCTYIGSSTTGILIDAGISCKATLERLEMVGVDPAGIRAICLTHDHADHRQGVGVLHRKLGVEVYANEGTVDALKDKPDFRNIAWNVFTTGQCFEIGDLELEPFSVPHDSYEPVGFAVSSGGVRVGIATDMGIATDLIRRRLCSCDALVLEANHDEEMLKASARPWPLKQRIAGRQGHLSNRGAGMLIAEVAGDDLRKVVLAHLSSDCNTPALALRTVQDLLVREGLGHIDISLASAARPGEFIRV